MKNKLLSATLFASVLLATNCYSQCTPPITTGLVCYLPFCGTANDASGNLNNGTTYSVTLTSDRFGNSNSAYSFNGSTQYISVPTSTSISFTNGISFSAWILPSALTNASVVDAMAGSGNGFRTNVRNSSSPSPIFWSCSGNYNTGITSVSTSQYAVGSWYNITGTWGNDDSVRVYFNGVLQQTKYAPYNYANANPIFIGRGRQSATYEFFNGKIDDISIFNRSITPAEVTQLYNSGLCFQTVTVTDTLIIHANLTGFNPVVYNNSIKIFPNPANDHISIDFGSNYATLSGYTLKIMNTLSQVVYTTAITQQTSSINLSSWTGNGVYFVHLIDPQSNTVEIRKIVLQ